MCYGSVTDMGKKESEYKNKLYILYGDNQYWTTVSAGEIERLLEEDKLTEGSLVIKPSWIKKIEKQAIVLRPVWSEHLE